MLVRIDLLMMKQTVYPNVITRVYEKINLMNFLTVHITTKIGLIALKKYLVLANPVYRHLKKLYRRTMTQKYRSWTKK